MVASARFPAESHPQPACISGSPQRPERQARSTGVDLSVARPALFTLFTWKTCFQVTMWGRPEQGLAQLWAVGLLPASLEVWVGILSLPKSHGQWEPGQRPGLWVLVFPLLLFHEPPWRPIWHTHWRGALLRSQSTLTQIVSSYPHRSPVGPVCL